MEPGCFTGVPDVTRRRRHHGHRRRFAAAQRPEAGHRRGAGRAGEHTRHRRPRIGVFSVGSGKASVKGGARYDLLLAWPVADERRLAAAHKQSTVGPVDIEVCGPISLQQPGSMTVALDSAAVHEQAGRPGPRSRCIRNARRGKSSRRQAVGSQAPHVQVARG